MIWIFNSQNKRIGSYRTFEEICDHFRRLEHLKPYRGEESSDEERWDFAYWPHKRLSTLHEHLKGTHFSQIEREAYESECDLIEIFDGNPELPERYMVTPDLDIAGLMKEWCFDYACTHGYTVLETFSSNLANVPSLAVHPTFLGHSDRGQGALQEGGQP